MKRKTHIGAGVLGLGFLILLGFVFMSGPSDPVYQGKRLSVWMEESMTQMDRETPPSAALRHYGKSAEPLIISMLRSRDTKVGLQLEKLLSKQHYYQFKFTPAVVYQQRAIRACSLLGPVVAGAVPALRELADRFPPTSGSLTGVHALNVLAVMGPDGIRALAAQLDNTNFPVRITAMEILSTAPASETPEVFAALKKFGDRENLAPLINRKLERLHNRIDHPLSAANWAEWAGGAIKEPFGLWDAQRGTRVIGTSGLLAGFKAEDIFGMRQSMVAGQSIFIDGKPGGSIHFVEWATPEPVTIQSFGLIAMHDCYLGAFQRSFETFRLYALVDAGEPYKLIYSEEVSVPYGNGHDGGMLFLYRNLEKAVTARRFRAEFVQYQGSTMGPRVAGLFGFGERLNWPMISAALQSEVQPVQDEAHLFFGR